MGRRLGLHLDLWMLLTNETKRECCVVGGSSYFKRGWIRQSGRSYVFGQSLHEMSSWAQVAAHSLFFLIRD